MPSPPYRERPPALLRCRRAPSPAPELVRMAAAGFLHVAPFLHDGVPEYNGASYRRHPPLHAAPRCGRNAPAAPEHSPMPLPTRSTSVRPPAARQRGREHHIALSCPVSSQHHLPAGHVGMPRACIPKNTNTDPSPLPAPNRRPSAARAHPQEQEQRQPACCRRGRGRGRNQRHRRRAQLFARRLRWVAGGRKRPAVQPEFRAAHRGGQPTAGDVQQGRQRAVAPAGAPFYRAASVSRVSCRLWVNLAARSGCFDEGLLFSRPLRFSQRQHSQSATSLPLAAFSELSCPRISSDGLVSDLPGVGITSHN